MPQRAVPGAAPLTAFATVLGAVSYSGPTGSGRTDGVAHEHPADRAAVRRRSGSDPACRRDPRDRSHRAAQAVAVPSRAALAAPARLVLAASDRRGEAGSRWPARGTD